MKMIELVAPCHFGMEAVLKRSLDLAMRFVRWRATFGDWRQGLMPMHFPTTERIPIKVETMSP